MAASDSALEVLDEVWIHFFIAVQETQYASVQSLRRERGDLSLSMAILDGEISQEGYSGAFNALRLQS